MLGTEHYAGTGTADQASKVFAQASGRIGHQHRLAGHGERLQQIAHGRTSTKVAACGGGGLAVEELIPASAASWRRLIDSKPLREISLMAARRMLVSVMFMGRLQRS
jgi:hypothetical protein